MIDELEKEVNARASEAFIVVLSELLEGKVREAQSHGDRATLHALLRAYVSAKIFRWRYKKRYDTDDYYCTRTGFMKETRRRLHELDNIVYNHRRRYHEFRQSVDPHARDCQCRSCRFLR